MSTDHHLPTELAEVIAQTQGRDDIYEVSYSGVHYVIRMSGVETRYDWTLVAHVTVDGTVVHEATTEDDPSHPRAAIDVLWKALQWIAGAPVRAAAAADREAENEAAAWRREAVEVDRIYFHG